MEQQLPNLLQQMQLSHNAQQEQLNRLAQMQEHQANVLRDMTERRPGIVDVRQVGKPENLSGTRDDILQMWPNWQFTFIIWFCLQLRNGEAILDWARDQNVTLDPTTLAEKAQQELGPN